MIDRLLGRIARVSLAHPGLVLLAAAAGTAFWCWSVARLRLQTDLADLLGSRTPEARTLQEVARKLGYGNQFFLMVEAEEDTEEAAERMERLADRLVASLAQSGHCKSARAGLTEAELLGLVRLYAWNFPAFLKPERREEVLARLQPEGIRRQLERAGSGLVTPFSSFATDYFVTDPLGLLEMAAPGGRALERFRNFDLNWGSGNRFFSQDHRALLVIADLVSPATDYAFAVELIRWTRQRIAALLATPDLKGSPMRVSLAGAHLYAEQDQRFMAENIRLVSLLSIAGNLMLCLLVYRRLVPLVLAFLPTMLGIVWTTGLVSYYPGEVTLISLSFIAILAGLGDDQVTYFFSRVPQEWAGGKSLDEAITSTFLTTGKSILFCLLTTSTGTLALALARFKGLAELGFILTVGLLMLLLHTFFTVPALMRLWWTRFPPRAPQGAPFRWLPAVAGAAARVVTGRPRLVLMAGVVLLAISLPALYSLRMGKKIEIVRGFDDPAWAGQRRLAQKFGLEGAPQVILLEGSQEDVLQRAEGLTAALEPLQKQGLIRSVFSVCDLVPSRRTQLDRARTLAGVDLAAVAKNLTEALRRQGFAVAAFQPAIDRLHELSRHGAAPLSIEAAQAHLPAGLLEGTIQRAGPGRYVASVAIYSADPAATASIPRPTLESLEPQFGPFVEFSFDKVSRDLQAQIGHDSRRALLGTLAGIVIIVALCFRDVRLSALVLLPIGYAIAATLGLLALAGRQFSFMAVCALPLIIGLGIDNGIHLVRRYVEAGRRNIGSLLAASGAALIQTNLTTMIGFGALTASSFAPLAEFGLVTAVGVGFTLLGALCLIPAILTGIKPREPPPTG